MVSLSILPRKWGARILNGNYGEIGLIGPFDSRTEAAAAAFKLTEDEMSGGRGCNGRQILYRAARGRRSPNGPIRHVVTSPIVNVGAGKWITISSLEPEWKDRYHRKEDGPENDRPWPPLKRDQL